MRDTMHKASTCDGTSCMKSLLWEDVTCEMFANDVQQQQCPLMVDSSVKLLIFAYRSALII